MLGTVVTMARRRSMATRVLLAAIAVVAIVSMHGPGVEAHSCETAASQVAAGHGDHHQHEHQGAAGAGESPAGHCGAMACTAIVTPAATAVPGRPVNGAAVATSCHLALVGTPTPPEPPVPRRSLHI